MLRALVSFELRRRLKRPSSFVYAMLLGLAGLFLMLVAAGTFKSISVATGSERVHANSPVTVFATTNLVALLGLFTVAAVFGQAATQDFTTGTWPIIFTRKLKTSTYVLGRFLGAYAFAALLFLAIPLGQAAGAGVAQLLDASQLGPHRLDVYLWPYLVGVLPMLFLAGAVFFALAALTRQMAPVYVGMVVLVLGYTVLSTLLSDVSDQALAALLDPFGFTAMSLAVRYWTPAESNELLVPLQGTVLLNKLVWTGVGAALLALTVARFRTTVDEEKGKGSRPAEADDPPGDVALPTTAASATTGSWLATSGRWGWLLFREVVRAPVYWAFTAAGVCAIAIGVVNAPGLYGTATLPVTPYLLELASQFFGLFSVITITFYAGELVWRERDAQLADLVDATRAPSWVAFGARCLALFLVAVSLQLVVGLATLGVQLGQGFTDLEPGVYVSELLGFGALRAVPLCALAISVQVLVNHKYLGHAVMVGYFVSRIALRNLGVEEPLLLWGTEPSIKLSQMNGHGHWLGAALLFRGYWYAWSGALLLAAGVAVVRGRETGLRARLADARRRVGRGWVAALAACLLAVAGLGGWLYRGAHLEHRYLTAKDQQGLKAAYEHRWKAWEGRAQPRVTAAELAFDVYPDEAEPRLHVKGTYTLTNRSPEAIAQVLVTLPLDARVGALAVGGASRPSEQDEDQGLRAFTLPQPLAPGASAPLDFELDFVAAALQHGQRRENVVGNGTFFDSFNLPVLGYWASNELEQDSDRKAHGLEPKQRLPAREDVAARQNNDLRPDSDFITLKATVSTVPDQLAVVPGTLVREWSEGGRRFFRYEMDQPILAFFSVLSARYEVLRDAWEGVTLEIDFHPQHRANLARMMAGMKDTLAYCSRAFGPYQHSQARIVEFPRYQTFAQSFPSTIPYSEAIGFIARVREDSETDLDYPYYVTAHEIAHQWWGHQAVGANVQGATLISESMAQYTALMVMKHRYGEKKMRRFLKYELDRYLVGRALERQREKPLARNENQPYIHYQKGSLVMYALQHFIGEDAVDGALRKYLQAVRLKGPPYTTAAELVAALREATPPEYAYLIDDLFETITLYDNRAVSASMRQTPEGAWDVTLKVKAVKYRADEKTGKQEEVPLDDFIDVGALDEHGEALLLEPRRLQGGESEVRFRVASRPARVGLDPLNMLLDRTSDDNTVVPTVE
jgi:ABC-2 type transport system permease protein